MTTDFSSIHNHYERAVSNAVLEARARYPQIAESLLPDVACVALTRLPSRYIRHTVDLVFYQTAKERLEADRLVNDAVGFAFEFVQARVAMRAR